MTTDDQQTPAMIRNGQPGEMHKRLDALVGEWDVEKTTLMAGGSPEKPIVARGIICRRNWIVETGSRFLRKPAPTQTFCRPEPNWFGRTLTHFNHRAWQSEQGLPQNTVQAIAQTRDGYLWLGTFIAYDDNGNELSDGVNTLVWNARNQLASISGPGLAASFQYDAFGRRTLRTVNGQTKKYLHDGVNVVQEQNASGAAIGQHPYQRPRSSADTQRFRRQ